MGGCAGSGLVGSRRSREVQDALVTGPTQLGGSSTATGRILAAATPDSTAPGAFAGAVAALPSRAHLVARRTVKSTSRELAGGWWRRRRYQDPIREHDDVASSIAPHESETLGT